MKNLSKSLPEYIAEIGDEASAVLFGVSVVTAASWRRRERFPRREKSGEIIAKTRHRVSLSGIYGNHDRVVFTTGKKLKQPSPA